MIVCETDEKLCFGWKRNAPSFFSLISLFYEFPQPPSHRYPTFFLLFYLLQPVSMALINCFNWFSGSWFTLIVQVAFLDFFWKFNGIFFQALECWGTSCCQITLVEFELISCKWESELSPIRPFPLWCLRLWNFTIFNGVFDRQTYLLAALAKTHWWHHIDIMLCDCFQISTW